MTTATVEATPVWRLAVASFLPLAKRDRALRAWIPRLPLILLLVVQAVLSLRLSNTAHGDEALYINAGIDYFDHWAHGTTIQTFGDYFSGAPVAFPVLAAVLNWIGGLWLVRIAGLLVMIGATLCVYAVTRHLWGSHAGVAASWTFVLAGPVVFLGKFATFDPWTVGFLAAALWLGVVRVGYASAALAGLSLAAAVAFKYTGMVFVPIVVAVIALTPRHGRGRPMVRAGVALLLAAGTLGVLYLLFGTAVVTVQVLGCVS
jgi:4-amino-4-deoxy-L-arabinose transferase-like glycosyltransferase